MQEIFSRIHELKEVNTVVTKATLDAMLACAGEFGVKIKYNQDPAEPNPNHIDVTYSHDDPTYDFSAFGKKYRSLLAQ